MAMREGGAGDFCEETSSISCFVQDLSRLLWLCCMVAMRKGEAKDPIFFSDPFGLN